MLSNSIKHGLIAIAIFCAISGQARRLREVSLPTPSGDSYVAQGIHPRLWLTPANKAAICTKIQNYYTDNPITTYADIVGSFGDFIAELDAQFGLTANQNNGLQWAHAYFLAAQLLPCLTTGGATGINPAHTASQYGDEGARLAVAITNLSGVDGGFPQFNVGAVYDWGTDYISAPDKANLRTVVQGFEPSCDALYASYFSADSHKTCSAMYTAAVAVANDAGETWGLNHAAEWASVMADNSTGIIGSESTVANLFKSTYGYGSGVTPGLAYSNYIWQYDMLASEAHRTSYTTQSRASFYNLTKYSEIPSQLYALMYMFRPFARNLADGLHPHDIEWKIMRTQYTDIDQMQANFMAGTLPAAFAGIWNDVESSPARLAMWMIRNRFSYEPVSSTRIGNYWVYRFLLEDPTISPADPATAGMTLSAMFGDGRYEFKQAFDPADSTNTNWNARWFFPHFSVPGDGREVAQMVGAYEIHYKGPASILSGAGAHIPMNIAGVNALVFRNNGRTTSWTSGDNFNLFMDGRPWGRTNQPQPTNRGADIVLDNAKDYLPTGHERHRFAGTGVPIDYTYADLSFWRPCGCFFTNASNSEIETQHEVEYTLFRSSAGNPVRIVAYHKYSVDSTSTQPTVVWRPSGDSITVDGSTTTGSFHGGSQFGHLKSTNSTVATSGQTNSFGTPAWDNKNVLTFVLPASRTMVIAGGPNESNQHFNDGTPDTWEDIGIGASLEAVDPYGFRFVHNGNSYSDAEDVSQFGQYNLQVQATTLATTGSFLYMNEVGVASMTPATVTILTGLDKVTGLQFRASDLNGIVVHSLGVPTATFAFTVPTAGTYTIVITDQSGSSRSITFAGSCGTLDVQGDTSSPYNIDTVSKTIVGTLVTSSNNCAVTGS